MQLQEKTNELSQTSSTSRLPDGWTERLIDRLSAMYGQKFTDQWHGVDPAYLKSVWSEELASYSADEIKTGLIGCRSKVWPPTLPEFLMLCRPAIDHESAFVEACNEIAKRSTNSDKWSHPAIYWAAVKFGSDLNVKYELVKNRWSKALAGELEKGSWDQVPRRVDALCAPGQNQSTPEFAKSCIDKLMGRNQFKVAT